METLFLKTVACTTFLETFAAFNEKNIEKSRIVLETFSITSFQSEFNELKEIQKQQLAIYVKLAFQNKEQESKEYLNTTLSATGAIVQSYERTMAIIGAIKKMDTLAKKRSAA